jgi:hypothetical protein
MHTLVRGGAGLAGGGGRLEYSNELKSGLLHRIDKQEEGNMKGGGEGGENGRGGGGREDGGGERMEGKGR